MLKKMGKKIFFVTNNSTKSRKGYLGKFKGLGLNDVEAEEIFSSSFAAAAYLEQTKFKDTGKKVYIIGEVGIEEELDLIGVPWIGGGADAGKKIELKSGYALPHDENVGAVIVGFDREINYHKIQCAAASLAHWTPPEISRACVAALTPYPPNGFPQVRAAVHQRKPGVRVYRHQPRRGDTPHRRARVGGQRRDDWGDQGVHGARADARGQAVTAHDRLHRRQVQVRPLAHLHGRRSS